MSPKESSHTLSLATRALRWLGGVEQVEGSGLPVEEFAHPFPLVGLLVLGLNDHLLKGSGWVPGWLTGKLSDFAGLFWFPLFVTAALDTLLYFAFRLSGGRTPDYSLSRAKLLGAIILTALLFVPLQLSEAWASLYIRAMHAMDIFDLFPSFAVVCDPWDLTAVVMFPLAYLHGVRFVRRVPIGRLRVLAKRSTGRPAQERRRLVEKAARDLRRLAGVGGARREALEGFLTAFTEALPLVPGSPAATRAQERLEVFRATLERTR